MAVIQSDMSLAPLEIWEVMLDNQMVKFLGHPLVLTPQWMPDNPAEPDEDGYMEVDAPELAISSYGTTIDELKSAVHSDIRFAWKHYVLANDSELTPDAVAVKNHYLAISEIVDE